MKSRWIVCRWLPRTDACIRVDVFTEETDARTYCDMRNRNVPEPVYFVSVAMNSD